MNQRPGTLIFMSSCHRPPDTTPDRSASRLIIAPPVATGIESAKIPCGPSTALMMSISGRCQQRLRPIDRRQLLRQVERLRRADQILLRRVRREHRPHLVLLSVEPGDEEHLHGAAAIPVALLVVGPTRPTPAPNPCGIIAANPGGACAATPICHSAVDEQPIVPTLPFDQGCVRHPLDRVVAIGERRRRGCRSCLRRRSGRARSSRRRRSRASPPSSCCGHVARRTVAHVPEVEVVRRAHEDDRVLLRGVLRTVDVGRHALADATPCAPGSGRTLNGATIGWPCRFCR